LRAGYHRHNKETGREYAVTIIQAGILCIV
jgi:hypothetical protein